jgi:hypothetical protein
MSHGMNAENVICIVMLKSVFYRITKLNRLKMKQNDDIMFPRMFHDLHIHRGKLCRNIALNAIKKRTKEIV